jgi:hypothetical protein
MALEVINDSLVQVLVVLCVIRLGAANIQGRSRQHYYKHNIREHVRDEEIKILIEIVTLLQ